MRIFYYFFIIFYFICLLNGLGSSGGFLIAYKGVQFVMMMAFLVSDFRILDFGFFFLSFPLLYLFYCPPPPFLSFYFLSFHFYFLLFFIFIFLTPFPFVFSSPPPCSSYSTYEVWKSDREGTDGRRCMISPSSENERE